MTFFLSKFLWAFASPGSFLALMLAVGLGLTMARKPCCRKAGKAMVVFVAVCSLAIAMLPVGEWALTPLEDSVRFDPPSDVAGIIVIGGDEQAWISEQRGMPVALDSMRRYVTFRDMARRYPNAQLVFSGGTGQPWQKLGHMQDADVAHEALADLGLPVDQMIFERNSRNTWENAVFSRDMVHPDPQQKWLLVTSAWHMPRALGCFRKAGWNIYPAPTGYFTPGGYHLRRLFSFDAQLHELTLAAHEYIGLVSYWLMGRIDHLWPG